MIKHKKFLTIFTFGIGFLICCSLLLCCGKLASTSGLIVYQHNYFSRIFLFTVGIFWLVGFLCYKVIVLEKKIRLLNISNQTNIELLQCICKNIGKIMNNQETHDKQAEIDFVNMQEFNQNTRDMILNYICGNKNI